MFVYFSLYVSCLIGKLRGGGRNARIVSSNTCPVGVRTLALLQKVTVNGGVGLPRRLAWAEAVQEGSPYFDDQGFMDIDLWVE